MHLATNPHAERAVLALVFQSGDGDKLRQLDEHDLADPFHNFLLSELNALVASGAPLGDATACATWFTSPSAKERAQTIGEDNLAYLAADVFGQDVIAAHWDYYVRLLRVGRLQRTLQSLSIAFQVKVERGESEAALAWLTDQVEQISEQYENACCSSSQLTDVELAGKQIQ